MKKYLLAFLTISLQVATAQSNNIFDFKQIHGVKVTANGDSLPNAWAGGLSSVSVNTMDLNLDGTQDLVIYEKHSQRVTTYITQSNGDYRYEPEYQSHFPTFHTTSWMIIKDYDCDGMKDVFYNIGSQIYVLQNTSNSSLSFVNPVGGALKVQVSSGQTTLYASEADKPAIEDIDNDGDLDFFSFSSGGSITQFNKNLANCGLDFKLEESCWGFFSETGVYRSVQLAACTPYRKKTMHSGSSMLLLDLNGDGLKDLLLGNVTFPDVTALYNTGSLDSTNFTSQDTLFPRYDRAISTTDFAALSYTDVTHDGTPDLLASPYLVGSGYEDQHSVHLYENIGTAANPVFNFSKDNFAQEDMIDLGTGAVPRLVDLNSDAKSDLVVSNFEMYDSAGTGRHFYQYYENTGNFGAPEFTLVDSNMVNISSYSLGMGSIPCFGDLDGDGDQDMIVGDENGQLHYFTNGSFTSPNFSLQTAGIGGFDVGRNAAPFLFDMDRDGDLDLLVGNNSGVLHYYENASATAPSFTLTNDFFGAVDTYNNISSSGRSIPYVFEHDSIINLFVGSTGQGVMQYDSIASVLSRPAKITGTIGTDSLISSNFEETPFGISKRNGRNQFIITAEELRAQGFSYGNITSISFDVTTINNATIFQGVSIRCKLTTDSVLNGFETGLTEVRNASLSGGVGLGKGWNDLGFEKQPFLWDGQSNLVIDLCFGGQNIGSDIKVKMTDVGNNVHAIGDYVDNGLNHDLGCKQPYLKTISKRPNVQLSITPALAPTNGFIPNEKYTAPAIEDLNLDGYPDMITGNMAGGLVYHKGKVYDVSLPEPTVQQAERIMEIFPNPGTGRFIVNVPEHGQASLSIFDLTGRMIMQKELQQKESTIDLSDQPTGIYLFILSDGEQLTSRKVILK
ncbi:MAG: T9SS type A sorting domain-containing protein [Owenweeksia sp.]|nr:T9SS type A sorting domain-containing protein [Owenweeksia sp.]